ncbi:TetR/AcrR family transcriptional regulator [Rathayibacter sp. SD072]|uniref:TetR/AcrR family transcriptional regulator n=1 Tax=Rathayibacter sp. SD072 TaxID=2781731 RepID=UPI001A967CF5|nr:TetR/AcrR family transcriptional regulator [Rathayibacter sp. SD072]MBO0984691.1 TetR/AcrR family transcriptional regulator [Rathayibacter sp. SD072]
MTSGATGSPATRTRLLDAAAELFYSQGVHVGVDALCRAAGVSKRSMYQLFDSKEELLAASLARSVPGYLAALLPAPELELPPRERVMHVFERLEAVVADPAFRGCPYVSAAMEIKEPEHPARVVARGFHDTLTEYFRTAVVRAGVVDSEVLAKQLTMVHDGVTARAVVQAAPTPGLAAATASVLLDHAGVGARD